MKKGTEKEKEKTRDVSRAESISLFKISAVDVDNAQKMTWRAWVSKSVGLGISISLMWDRYHPNHRRIEPCRQLR